MLGTGPACDKICVAGHVKYTQTSFTLLDKILYINHLKTLCKLILTLTCPRCQTVNFSYSCTHTSMHARTHARTHAHTHTHTHACTQREWQNTVHRGLHNSFILPVMTLHTFTIPLTPFKVQDLVYISGHIACKKDVACKGLYMYMLM